MKSYVPAIAVTVVSTLIATALTAAGLRSYKKWGTMRRSSQAFTISAGLMILVVIVLKLTPGDNSGLLADVIVTAIFLALLAFVIGRHHRAGETRTDSPTAKLPDRDGDDG
jgi:ABC-type xylose transport system permease subunit